MKWKLNSGSYRKWIGALSIVFLLASCTSTAHVEKDENTDFRNYKTFAWLDKKNDVEKDQHKTNDLIEQKIKQAVNQELEKNAGWLESKNHPDILLSYDVLVERGIKENSNPVYTRPFSRLIYNPYTRRYATIYYPSQFIGYDRDQRNVKEGTVTVTMIDSNTDKMVWQGWATDEINNRNITSREIQNSVKAIFRKFDIAKK